MNLWSQSGRRKGRLRWEGFAEKESFKLGVKEWRGNEWWKWWVDGTDGTNVTSRSARTVILSDSQLLLARASRCSHAYRPVSSVTLTAMILSNLNRVFNLRLHYNAIADNRVRHRCVIWCRCRTLNNDSQTAWHPGRICWKYMPAVAVSFEVSVYALQLTLYVGNGSALVWNVTSFTKPEVQYKTQCMGTCHRATTTLTACTEMWSSLECDTRADRADRHTHL